MFHVKHDLSDVPTVSAISEALEAAGLSVEMGLVGLLARHAHAVYTANASFNLTRITSTDSFVRLHIVDSLLPWTLVPFEAPAVDLGSGAGFPGIPTAVVHGGPMLLCESVGKKAHFLETCASSMGLPCRVFPGRAEDLALNERGSARLVVARAVSSLASLVELATPLLTDGGRLVALKGDPTTDELSAGDRAATVCGMRRLETLPYALPGGEERRTLVIYGRIAEPSVGLPRRSGLAQHHPLP